MTDKLVCSEMRQSFNKWFTKLLYITKTCQERDVLRDSKEDLWKNWLEAFGDKKEGKEP